jgi:hypothetical protein
MLIESYSQADTEFYDISKCRVLGLCTGALSAAAVSCSNNTVDLVPLAVEAVIAAFRTGMVVTDAAKRIAPWSNDSQSWSMIVPGTASTEAVQKFGADVVSSPH